MITPETIVSFAIGGAIGSAWSTFILGRILRNRYREIQKLLAQNDLQREQFKLLARHWLALARRVNRDDARVEQVAQLLAAMEVRDVLARGAEHVS